MKWTFRTAQNKLNTLKICEKFAEIIKEIEEYKEPIPINFEKE